MKLKGKNATIELKKKAKKLGANLVGMAPIKRWEKAPKGFKPNDLLRSAKSVISLGKRESHGMIDEIATKNKSNQMAHVAHVFEHVNPILANMSHNLAIWIEEELECPAVAIQPTIPYYPGPPKMGIFSHRHAAVNCGLATFGLNNLALTPEYGPRIRFVSIITSAEFEYDSIMKEEVCTKCKTCWEVCPIQAWDEEGNYAKDSCAAFMEWNPLDQKCYLDCSLCKQACPIGLEARPWHEKENI